MGFPRHVVALVGFHQVVLEALGEMGGLEAPPSPVALAAVLLDLPRPHVGNVYLMICDEARAVRGKCASVSRLDGSVENWDRGF